MKTILVSSLFLFLVLTSKTVRAVPFEGHQMLMTGPSPYAIEVGKAVAERGGNVVDVAVAMGLSLSVTTPYYATLGGGGFALVKMDKNPVEAVDFRETAPTRTHRDYFMSLGPKAAQDGGAAVGVPGFPKGLIELHKKYGRLPWKELFRTPIQLARNGFRVSGEWSRITAGETQRFNSAGRRFLFKTNAEALKPGEMLRQPQLAKALELLRDKKDQGFYEGPVAQDMVQTVKNTGGVLELSDLKNYRVRWLKPLVRDFRNHRVYLMPPPSSGGLVIATALDLVQRLKVDQYPTQSADEIHALGEVLRLSFRGRSQLGDPDFHKNPIEALFSKTYVDELAKNFSIRKASTLKPVTAAELDTLPETSETTHYAVMDKEGNAVTLTVTANGNYGSAVLSERFGITLNNEMDDFMTRPGEPNQFGLIQGEGNSVAAGKRPLSSMSPTLVEKDGQTLMVLGAPGGPRIISAVFQGLYRALVTGVDIETTVQMPRVHHQFLPHQLFLDPDRFSPDVVKSLEGRGHRIELGRIAKLYGIRRHPKGWLEAAHDNRGEGASGGF